MYSTYIWVLCPTYISEIQGIASSLLNLQKNPRWIILSRRQETDARKPLPRKAARKTKETSKKGSGVCRDSQRPHWDSSPTSIECEGERALHVLVLRIRARAVASPPLSWERTRVSRRVTVFVPRTGSRVGKWRNGRNEEARSRVRARNAPLITRYGDFTRTREHVMQIASNHRSHSTLHYTRNTQFATRRVHGFVYGSQVFDAK